jgi:hypothetical protein
LSIAFTKEDRAETASETLLPDRWISPHPNMLAMRKSASKLRLTPRHLVIAKTYLDQGSWKFFIPASFSSDSAPLQAASGAKHSSPGFQAKELEKFRRWPPLLRAVPGAGDSSQPAVHLRGIRSCRFRLFASRTGVHVDFHANRHFNDFWSPPGHLRSPLERNGRLPYRKRG